MERRLLALGAGLTLVWAVGMARAQQVEPFEVQFSVDIGSDTELSDPQADGDEGFDPGDVYLWRSAPVTPPEEPGGRDGFKDDEYIFGQDPPPDPPFPPVVVPVGSGGEDDYRQFFDLDGHDEIDVDLREFGLPEIPEPVPEWPSPCIFLPEFVYVSFDDDQAPGWPWNDVPVTVPSASGLIYGASGARDEVVGMTVDLAAGWPPYPLLVPPAGVLDEVSIHASLTPNPDAGDPDDDDVDSLDVVRKHEDCPYWYFSPDHEAQMGLDPGDIYLVTPMGPVLIVDDVMNLGLPDGVDVDAFEFTWIEMPARQWAVLGVLFSVDEDDPVTPNVDESGGLNPNVIYYSILTGWSDVFLQEPLQDDVDAITIWLEELDVIPPQIVAAFTVADHSPGAGLVGLPIDLAAITSPAIRTESREEGVQQIDVVFSEPVDPATVDPSVVSVVGWVGGPPPVWITTSLDPTQTVMTINFNPPLPDQDTFTITIANTVTDLAGNPLAGDLDFNIRALQAEVSNSDPGPQVVNAIDLSKIRLNFGADVTIGDNAKYDIVSDGVINALDLSRCRMRFSNTAP